MKVLLAAVNAKYIHSNLGIYSLKAYARKALGIQEGGRASGPSPISIDLAEYTINHQTETILQDIYKRKPDFIGFSCYIWNISCIKALLPDIKKVLPNVQIWLGGPEVSYDGEQVLKDYPEAEGIMKGEGESVFAQLLCAKMKGKPLSGVPGLLWRTSDEAIEDTGEPGFGGQAFMESQLDTIRQVRAIIDRYNPACELEVDGGIAPKTAPLVVEAGANVLVAGSAVYGKEDIPAAIAALRT